MKAAPINMLEATRKAKSALQEIVGRQTETVARCNREGEEWTLEVEVVESKAHISDNDVIAAYELVLDAMGEVLRYSRLRRYRRADAPRDAAA
ncbi:MAG: gas vesicle synthesis protein [Methylobacterium sp.]|nr:MAG: gas vesicle synthesis protein [Methylobacterium sp.]